MGYAELIQEINSLLEKGGLHLEKAGDDYVLQDGNGNVIIRDVLKALCRYVIFILQKTQENPDYFQNLASQSASLLDQIKAYQAGQ